MHPRPLTTAVAFAAASVLSACGGSTEPVNDASDADIVADGAVTMAFAADPGTLDPTKSLIGSAQQINRFTYDSLVNADARGDLVSGLAEKWTVTPTTLTFTLRRDVTCADGTAFTPAVAQQNFEFLKRTKSPLIGTAIPDPNFTVTADDVANTFTFTASAPNGFLLQNVGSIPMVCPKGLAAPEKLARESAGTGPYVISEFVSADHVTVTRRDDYTWGPKGARSDTKGLPKTVTFKIVKSESTIASLLLNGQVNIAQIVGSDRDRVSGKDYNVKNVNTDSLILSFNQRNPILADEQVRVALAHGLNRDEAIKTISSGTGTSTASLISVQPKPCDDSDAGAQVPAFDADTARSALDEAGWVTGSDGFRSKNGRPLRLTVSVAVPGPTGPDTAELIAQGWKEIGIDVRIKTIPTTQLSETLFSKFDYDVIAYPLQVQLPSTIYGLLSGPAAPAGSNFSPVTNADYDRLGRQAAATPGEEGCRLWTQAHAALYKAADLVPVGGLTGAYVGRDVRYEYIGGFVDPMSIRALAT